MLHIFKKLFAGEPVAVVEPVLTPPGFAGPRLPVVDVEEAAPAEPVVPDDVVEALKNRAFVIVYVDTSGNESERRIMCREVYPSGGKTYVQAICLERRAPRLFRVDRIEEVYCGVTGENLGAPDIVFVSWGPERPVRRPPQPDPAVTAARRALRVLATLARCDGAVHPSEERVIREFLDAGLPAGVSAKDRAELLDYGLRLAPSYGSFVESFEQLLEASPRLVPAVLMAAIDVAEADGHWHPEEMEAIKFLIDVARENGVEVHIDL